MSDRIVIRCTVREWRDAVYESELARSRREYARDGDALWADHFATSVRLHWAARFLRPVAE